MSIYFLRNMEYLNDLNTDASFILADSNVLSP